MDERCSRPSPCCVFECLFGLGRAAEGLRWRGRKRSKQKQDHATSVDGATPVAIAAEALLRAAQD